MLILFKGRGENLTPIFEKKKKKGINVPAGLQLVLFVPDVVCETSAARALLTPEVSFPSSSLVLK